MRLGIVTINTKGKPEERHIGPFGEVKELFKRLDVPDTHASLYQLQRVRVKHVPAAVVSAATSPAPANQTPTQKKGKV